MDRGAWQATVHRVAKCQTRLKRLSNATLFPNVQCYMQIGHQLDFVSLVNNFFSGKAFRKHLIWGKPSKHQIPR